MKRTVLVVDDDEAVRRSLNKILRDAGYEVEMAAGGLEAALRFEPDRIDLLLLDLNLPNQSGWEVLSELTARHPHLPVIVITGLPDQLRTALAVGVGALFEKPVEVPALLGTIETLLADPEAARLGRARGPVSTTQYQPPAGHNLAGTT